MPGRILVTGGGGQLARELIRLDPSLDAPDRKQLDVSVYENIDQYCLGKAFQTVIHAGAATNKFSENIDDEYIRSNIIGTSNVVLWAMRHNVRVVYVSTDYVYPSERGDYTEESVLFPVNKYARSKLGGEMAVSLYDNSLVIRTSFYGALNFPRACVDQFTSRLPIADAALAIYRLAIREDVRGIVNVGTTARRSVYGIVKSEFNSSIESGRRADIRIPYIIPPDSSMETGRFHRLTESTLQNSTSQTKCRICKSDKLFQYLALGSTPLANSYLRKEDLGSPEFREELSIQVCLDCGLSQLTKVVNPDFMFKNYLYVSSTTQTFRDHCVELAKTATTIVAAQGEDLVLDIASNDGCLLSRFQDLGMKVLGVDPAENLSAEANANGIKTLCTYWSEAIAKDIVSRFGTPKIITATNVFAHVDDVHEFVEAVDLCLARGGIFVIECPYLMDFIERNEFDTAYHEHLSYLAIRPLMHLMQMHSMQVFDVQYFREIHGGTVRVLVSRPNDYAVRESVGIFLAREEAFGIRSRTPYESFAARVMKNKRDLRTLIAGLHAEGKTIWAYGASAKGNTLMNFFELANDVIPVVIDDNPKKWGHYTPGSHMRITGIEELGRSHVDYLLLLAWNFQSEIIRRCTAVRYPGKYILPVPEPTIIAAS